MEVKTFLGIVQQIKKDKTTLYEKHFAKWKLSQHKNNNRKTKKNIFFTLSESESHS